MKPCSRNRKNIALLAVAALDAAQERDLRTHLERCPGCHGYWRQMSALTGKLASAQLPTSLEASERFHQRVVRAVRSDSPSEIPPVFRRWSSLPWRVALPVIGISTVAVAMLSLSVRRSQTPQPSTAALRSAAVIQADLEPSVMNYQMVANESLDRLDELLTRQGNRNPPPGPRSIAPGLGGANAWE